MIAPDFRGARRDRVAAVSGDVRERPILFSAPMIRAILEGRKTVTRRIVRVDDTPITEAAWRAHKRQRGIPSNAQNVRMCGSYVKCDAPAGSATVSSRVECPYGWGGDRLWVRETLRRGLDRAWTYAADDAPIQMHAADPRVPAMRSWAHHKEGDVCVSIHMPRWASRISLEVTSVRVERLQSITEDDARAEGVTPFLRDIEGGDCWSDGTARSAFHYLWGQINGFDSWEANPHVWVVSFARVP